MSNVEFASASRGAGKERLGPLWKSRLAATAGAVALGLMAIAFAWSADQAMHVFNAMVRRWPYAPLGLTPLVFGLLAWFTRRYAPAAKGSGIPQVLAATEDMGHAITGGLLTIKTSVAKFFLTIAGLAVGASVGREGPTVQIGAAVMAAAHRLLKIPLTPAVAIAGGAAGVSAAFNTPLAGVAFAIEELAAAYEQRLAVLVMAAVMISGFVSLTVSGDYVYFGAMQQSLPVLRALVIAGVAGVVGGRARRAVLAHTVGGAQADRPVQVSPRSGRGGVRRGRGRSGRVRRRAHLGHRLRLGAASGGGWQPAVVLCARQVPLHGRH